MSSSYYYVDEPSGPPPPRWWIGYVAGALLMLIGAIVPCAGTAALIARTTPVLGQGTTVSSAGKSEFQVDKPEAMVVWLEESSPSVYAQPTVPKDLKVTITAPGGAPVRTGSPRREHEDGGMSDKPRAAIVAFTPSATGTYTIDVKGKIPDTQAIVVAPDDMMKVMKMGMGVFGMIGIGGVLFLGGLVTLIVIIVKHVSYRRSH